MTRDWLIVPGVGYRLTIAEYGIRFDLSRVRRDHQETIGLLTVRVSFRGARTIADDILSSADFNCSSQRARSERAKFLRERSNTKDDDQLDWVGLLEDLCLRVLEAEEGGEAEQSLESVAMSEADDTEFTPGDLPLLRRHPTIWFGDGGCVAGETRLGDERIDRLAAMAQPITVVALSADGPVTTWAHAPVARGIADLYRFELSSGQSVIATMAHRFLTPSGWQYAAALRSGDAIAVSAQRLPVSSDAVSLSRSIEGAPHWRRSVQDLPGHYSNGSRRDDARLLTVRGSGQSRLQQLDGARARSLVSWRTDGLVGAGAHNHRGQQSVRLSRNDFSQAGLWRAGAESDNAASRATRHSENTRSGSPFPEVTHPSQPMRGSTQSGAVAVVGPCLYSTVTAISFERRDVFYDLTVPGFQNYLANGIWHHNCGKSYLALYAATALVQQGARVLYCDWEFSGEDHRRRLQRLIGPVPGLPELLYRRCDRPLVRDVARIKEIIGARKVTFLICDSLGFAAEGAPEAAEAATGYFRAVREFGALGSLHLAHISKAEQGDQKPFGSVFWNNGARATWFLKRTDAEATGDGLTVGLYHRKSNVGRLRTPLGMRIRFGGTETQIYPTDLAAHDELAAKLPIWQRMQAALRRGALDADTLAAELDIKDASIRNELRRRGELFTRLPDGRIGLRVN